MLKEIDLNDPTVKALYDSYPEDRKNEFEEAYVYMKYFGLTIATIKSIMLPGIPLDERIEKALKDASPELHERMKKTAVKILQGLKGGQETSMYNGKIIGLENAVKLTTIDVDVDIEAPTTVLPFKLARDIVLEGNPAIAIGKCGCRSTIPEADVKCLSYPYEACLFVGDPGASFVAKHGDTFRKIDSEEAVRILEDFHDRGFVQQAYFKSELNGFYAICNCCPCCCNSITRVNKVLDGDMPFTNTAASGYIAEIGNDCVGCGECMDQCPYHAIKLNEDETRAEIVFNRCMGCSVCESQCPTEAITMRAEPSKGGILDIDELRKAAQIPM
jgi:Pyruvate/2-oxoacid:ferredoxin oxidoreductase delta subunit